MFKTNFSHNKIWDGTKRFKGTDPNAPVATGLSRPVCWHLDTTIAQLKLTTPRRI